MLREQTLQPIDVVDVTAGQTIRAEFLGYPMRRLLYVDEVIEQETHLYVKGRWVRSNVYTGRTFPTGDVKRMKVRADMVIELVTPGATP